jgi:hypothetical protein
MMLRRHAVVMEVLTVVIAWTLKLKTVSGQQVLRWSAECSAEMAVADDENPQNHRPFSLANQVPQARSTSAEHTQA